MADDAHLTALIVTTLEEAGLSGLCLEGQIELAIDRLRREHPEIDAARASALVQAVLGKREISSK